MKKLCCGQFYGDLLNSREVAGAHITETRHQRGLDVPQHCHENAYFCFVRRGTYTERYGQQTRECRPLTLAFHPAGERHSEQLHTSVRSLNIEFTPQFTSRTSTIRSLFDKPFHFSGGPAIKLATRLNAEFHQKDEASGFALEGLLMELIGLVMRTVGESPATPSRRIREAHDLLESQFASRLTLSRVSHAVGLHPVYLAAAFRKQYGCSVGEYLRRLRIQYACRQLVSSDRTIAEIAASAGFCDQSHFSRTFKQETGAISKRVPVKATSQPPASANRPSIDPNIRNVQDGSRHFTNHTWADSRVGVWLPAVALEAR